MPLYRIEKAPPLRGSVVAGTSKNAVLPIMVAGLLTQEELHIQKVPGLSDVDVMIQLLTCYGAHISRDHQSLVIKTPQLEDCQNTYEKVRAMRASVLLMGPVLARHGQVRMALPGGCAIGARPIDQHIKGLVALGAKVEIADGVVMASCRKLRGCDIFLDMPSVGATENLLMACVLAEGTTHLYNVAQEPEVQDLAHLLNKMGARIHGIGSRALTIEGVEGLGGTTYTPIADRIEAGTILCAGLITGGAVRVERARAEHLTAVLAKLQEAGYVVGSDDRGVWAEYVGKRLPLDIATLPYPGFPTDMQAPMMALCCIARGVSFITETVFEARFVHVPEMARMGAHIRTGGQMAAILGGETLQGARVQATDLRGGAALILAGLAAEGVSWVEDVGHIQRGYESLENKLGRLGANIKRS